jgi:hypothetical protein
MWWERRRRSEFSGLGEGTTLHLKKSKKKPGVLGRQARGLFPVRSRQNKLEELLF